MFGLMRKYFVSLLMVFLCAHSYANEKARETVVNVVDRFNVEIVQDKVFLAKNRGELVKRVDAILTPVINFDDFSKVKSITTSYSKSIFSILEKLPTHSEYIQKALNIQ